MSLTLPPEIASPMQAVVNKNLLKFAAGNAMFCRECGTCMDWKRTSIVTIDPGPNERLIVGCCTCVDKAMLAAKPALEARNMPFEVLDGRTFATPKKTRAPRGKK